MSSRRIVRAAGIFWAAAWCLHSFFAGNTPVWGQAAQVQIRVGQNGAANQATGVQPPTDRVLSRGMQRAEASIKAGEFSQAIRFLDEVLGMDEDSFVELG